MPTKTEHLAAIQSALITAAFDLNQFQWTVDDARLLQVVEHWLEGKAQKSPVALSDGAGIESGRASPELDGDDATDDDENARENVPRQRGKP